MELKNVCNNVPSHCMEWMEVSMLNAHQIAQDLIWEILKLCSALNALILNKTIGDLIIMICLEKFMY